MLFLIIGLALGALLGVLFMRNKSGLNPLDFQKEMQLEKEKAGLAATLQEQLKQMELLVNEKEQYKNAEGNYTTYVAYEIHKKDMFRYLKKQAKLNKQLNESERKKIEEILEEEIKKAEKLDE